MRYGLGTNNYLEWLIFEWFTSEAISPARFSILPYIKESWKLLERNPTKADVIINEKILLIPLLSYKTQNSTEGADITISQ